MEEILNTITHEHIKNGMSYDAYRLLIDQLFEKNKTTGSNHSEAMLNYAKLNMQRMNKWDKIAKPSEELVALIMSIDKPMYWVVLTEGWCGDAAQNLPLIAKLASMNSNITLSLLLRDENLEVMDAYLTNGGRSIPKMIVLDDQLNELGQWGPRPQPVHDILMEMKASPDGFSYAEFNVISHTWYAKDRTKTLQQELLTLLGPN
jgi:hypothetical protein